jgi:predicted nucleic acid-binding Zn ribbon protein
MYQVDTEISIGQAIQLYLKQSKLKGNMQAMQLDYIWESIMGKTIAKYTNKLEIFEHKLIIHTNVAPLKQELQFQKEKIMERVNEALQENIIKEVVIR